ncbi:MAG: DUF167 domain-containing protein [Candidatus Eisenbacteria bacterium]|nr:DUF167 domain-containing protein [Candidatus Eisenbacteria bacterium]
MKISVVVRANSKVEKVEEASQGSYRIWVKEPRKGGRANAAVLRALGAHFGIPVSRIAIKSGHTSSRKIVEIV